MPDRAPNLSDVSLGFDYGKRRVGIAVGNIITGSAQPLETLAHREGIPDWDALAGLMREWQPGALVVGLPLDRDGTTQKMTHRAQNFMNELRGRFKMPVYAVDERFTTIEARARLRAARASGSRSKRLAKGDSDAMAAQVILESWLIGAIESHKQG